MARFDLVVREIAEGGTLDGATIALAMVMSIDEERAHHLLTRLPAVVASGLEEHAAEPLFHTLRDAGLVVQLRRVEGISSRPPARPPALGPSGTDQPADPIAGVLRSTPPASRTSTPPPGLVGRERAPIETADHLGLAPLDLAFPTRPATRPPPAAPLPSRTPVVGRRKSARPATPVGFWAALPSVLTVPLRRAGLQWIAGTALSVVVLLVAMILGTVAVAVLAPRLAIAPYVAGLVVMMGVYASYFRACLLASFEGEEGPDDIPLDLYASAARLGTAVALWSALLFGVVLAVTVRVAFAGVDDVLGVEHVIRGLSRTWPLWWAAALYLQLGAGLVALRSDWRAFVDVLTLGRLLVSSPLQLVATLVTSALASVVASIPLVLLAIAVPPNGLFGSLVLALAAMLTGIYMWGATGAALGVLFRANADIVR